MRLARPLLLVSDLDDTLIGHEPYDASTAAFRDVWERSQAAGVPCRLVVNTGRTLPLFEQALQQKRHCLVVPDVLIAGVGTRIYHKTSAGWREDPVWTERMQEGWDASRARQLMQSAVTTLGSHSVLFEPETGQHEHKLTALFTASVRGKLLALVEQGLAAAGMQATLVEGTLPTHRDWHFMDLVPKNAGKGSAMHYVRSRLGWAEACTVACGDSWNDMCMLAKARVGIVVGNAVPEVRTWAAQENQRRQQAAALQPAEADPSGIYLAAQPCAAGVLEGLHAWGFLTQ